MKSAFKRVSFNGEYTILMAVFAGVLMILFLTFRRPEVDDGAAWFQGIASVIAIFAALAIPALQRKHQYIRDMEETNLYTVKAYQVASHAVDLLLEAHTKGMILDSGRSLRCACDGLSIMFDALDGFEVSKMSGVESAISLLRLKQQVKDAQSLFGKVIDDQVLDPQAARSLHQVCEEAVDELVRLRASMPRI